MRPARACVFGAGALGCHLAAALARSGVEVSVLARGETLAALRRDGIRLEDGDAVSRQPVMAHGDTRDIGPQDTVFVTVKAHALAAAADQLLPLVEPGTAVAFAQNGIPWWYGHAADAAGGPAPPGSAALARLSAGGHVLGAVVHSSSSLLAPGRVRNESPGANRLLVAEIDDTDSERVRRVRGLLQDAGFASPPVADIRRAVWRKLLLNLAGSSLCALTRRDMRIVGEDPAIGDLFERLLREGLAIAAALGIRFDPAEIDVPALRRGNGSSHKPSLLQDLESGRPLEIDAILRTPQAFARAHSVDTPVLDTVIALLDRAAADRQPTADTAARSASR